MNIVGIDISKNSTGISIMRNDEIILFNFTTTKKSYVWIKKVLDNIDFEFITYTHESIKSYSEKEIIKLREFDKVSDIIFNKVLGNIDKTQKTYISIEGYNFGKNTNSIIDIVTLSTLIRKKLYEGIPNLVEMVILSPLTVKSKTCEMVYGSTITETTNKKGVKKITKKINKSPDDITGTKFQKHDMLKAIIDLNVDVKLNQFLKDNKDELLSYKNIPKPFDDLIDAMFIMLILKDMIIEKSKK